MNRTKLVIELFNPNENGVSRWVLKDECVGKFNSLYPTNGNVWYRNKGVKKYILETDHSNSNTRWRFNGFNKSESPRTIKSEIWVEIRNKPCVVTGLKLNNGHKIEVDHKDGRYPEEVLNVETQTIEHFQPLLESLNKQKRSDCSKCKKTNVRFDAKEKGFAVSVTQGSLEYEGSCKGCYWFDVADFISKLG
jgi:hypothetical protein